MERDYETNRWVCPHCGHAKEMHVGKETSPWCPECVRGGELVEMEVDDE